MDVLLKHKLQPERSIKEYTDLFKFQPKMLIGTLCWCNNYIPAYNV